MKKYVWIAIQGIPYEGYTERMIVFDSEEKAAEFVESKKDNYMDLAGNMQKRFLYEYWNIFRREVQ